MTHRRRNRRVLRVRTIGLEKHLEDWIVNDVTLIGEGYTLVGRQVSIYDGRLDLLAIDSRDRWLVIESQARQARFRRARTGSLHMRRRWPDSTRMNSAGSSNPTLASSVMRRRCQEKLEQQLADEGEEREIAVLLVGAGLRPGLERMNEFLARFGVPIGVVSFEVFKLDDGPQLLIREVVEEPN